MTSKTVHFTVEGAAIVEHMRDLMLSGQEDKAFKNLCLSLQGMTGDIAERILEGQATLTGKNSDITLVEESDPDYIAMLAEVRSVSKRLKEEEDPSAWRDYAVELTDRATPSAIIGAKAACGMIDQKVPGYAPSKRPDPDEGRVDAILGEFLNQMKPVPHVGLTPHKMTPDDINHYTWMMDPKGNLYKIPYQEHGEWIIKNYEDLLHSGAMTFDEYGEPSPRVVKQGWIRISGGPGLGMVIDVPTTMLQDTKYKLMDFVLKHAFKQFTISCEKGEGVFEIGIDYKRAKRLINENVEIVHDDQD